MERPRPRARALLRPLPDLVFRAGFEVHHQLDVADAHFVARLQLLLGDLLAVNEGALRRAEIGQHHFFGRRDLDHRVHATDGIVVELKRVRSDLADLDLFEIQLLRAGDAGAFEDLNRDGDSNSAAHKCPPMRLAANESGEPFTVSDISFLCGSKLFGTVDFSGQTKGQENEDLDHGGQGRFLSARKNFSRNSQVCAPAATTLSPIGPARPGLGVLLRPGFHARVRRAFTSMCWRSL